MASTYTTDNRTTTLTVNGKGPFIVTKVILNEKISGSSELLVDLVTDKTFIPDDLGQVIELNHILVNKEKVTIFLLATNIAYQGYSVNKGLNHYQLTAADPLSILKYDIAYRVFQQKNTKDIITEILTTASLNSYVTFDVTSSGQMRDFCLQLNENSYDFIARLCAEEGWHFHCKRSNKLQMVIADSNQAFTDYANNIAFINPTSEISEVLQTFEQSLNLGTSSIDLADFSFKNGERFTNEVKSSISHPLNLKLMSYGIGTKDKAQITTLSKNILAGIDTPKESFTGTSENFKLHTGMKFSLKNHPNSAFNQTYLITSIKHTLLTNESGQNDKYTNSFTCIVANKNFIPPYLPKPTFSGTLTATVTGPNDKEIYTDDKGRIKVLFHFDRLNKEDENSSIWVPVGQNFTANGFGSLFLPRISSTVVITFLNGDIDKPIVLSSIYTDNQKLPFASSSQSGFKTHSTPNGSDTASNELRFDDQKDNEQIYIHAQKDLITAIENDVTESIKGNKTITIEKKLTTQTKEEVAHSTEKSYTITAKENLCVTTEADFAGTTKGKHNIIVTGALSENTDDNYALNAKKDISIDGNNITITGKQNIKLKVGSSSIEISSSGITITASKITIKGSATSIESSKLDAKGSAGVSIAGANIDIKANAKAKLSGLMTEVNAQTMATVSGSAMLTLKGGLTRIN